MMALRWVVGRRVAGMVAALAAGVSAFSGMASGQAQAQTSPDLAPNQVAPNQVIAFDGENYDGAARAWTLDEGQLYRFVPSVGSDLIGKISSFKVGGQVGVALFSDLLFQNTDKSCAPILGSAEEPSMLWRGATADFLPGSRGGTTPLAAPAPKNDSYASLILYRRDMGPPPGVLMLQRLNNYSRGCKNVLEQLNYRRIFVPAWEAGRTGYCINLVGPSRYEDVQATLRFNDTDQLVFLHPEAMDRAYRPVRHRVRATLYDFPDCQGNKITLPFKAESVRKFNLADYGFKGKGRSLMVQYVSGPARNIAPVAAAPATSSVVSSSAPAATPTPQPVPDTQTASQPPVKAAEQPVSEPVAPKPVAPKSVASEPVEPAVQPQPQQQSAAKVVEPIEPETTVVEPEPVVKSEPAAPKVQVEPQAPSQAPVKAEPQAVESIAAEPVPVAPTPSATPQPDPAPSYAVDPDLAAAGITPAGDDSLIPKPDAAPDGSLERDTISTQSEDPLYTPSYQLFQPEGQESVEGESLSSNGSSPSSLPTETESDVAARPAGGQTFEYPVYDAYRLNYCLQPGAKCGEAAASEWCRKKGYKQALGWVRENNIGHLFPTINMESGDICAIFRCDGFKEVTCGN